MLSYSRCEGGQYLINLEKVMVGFIKKQSASKWIMYKTANLAVLGDPIVVTKTLKELKSEAEVIFGQITLDEAIEDNLDALLDQIQGNNNIEVNHYDVNDDRWEEPKVPAYFGKFLTASDIESL